MSFDGYSHALFYALFLRFAPHEAVHDVLIEPTAMSRREGFSCCRGPSAIPLLRKTVI
jgi:hypothetical protein